jgi:N-acetylglucosaminyldiphosphoundecaprenol N-acetyl-beta-D-mannosaminyltransferase
MINATDSQHQGEAFLGSAGPMVDLSKDLKTSYDFTITPILGTPIAMVDQKRFLQIVSDWLAHRTTKTSGEYINFRDVHGVVRALKEPALAHAHDRAFMNVPDGRPLVWISRLRGRRVGQVCGPDTLPALCNAGLAHGWRHAFFGGTPAVLENLVARMKGSYPGLDVVEAISPPFRPMAEEETQTLIARLADAKPDFVWIGLGCPKQELWMSQYAGQIPGALSMGVGAAFDFHAGTVQRAPVWVRRLGLEFLYRALQEPKRLGRRYAQIIPHFIIQILKEELRLRMAKRG